MELKRETESDGAEVEALYDLCFAPGRTALPSYRLREGVEPVSDLCMVARDEAGILAGAIRYWPILVGEDPALLLGPVAVHPTRQGEGLGRLLIEGSLMQASGWKRVLLVGDEAYYKRFGFKQLTGVIMPSPANPDRVLGRDLTPDAWRNVEGFARPMS